MALSKEEKKAKKEAKRLEKLQAIIEVRRKLKREELNREIAAHALKREEVDKTWRNLMMKIKEPVFRNDIEVMCHTFERAYDKKDHLINHTMKLMDTADDQFQRTVASFCVTIDTMINKFLQDLDEISKENERRTASLLQRGEDDATLIMLDHNAAETNLQLLLYHGHTAADSLAWTTRGENLVKQDEDRGKYINERENLRSLLENNYNTMWEEYKAVLKNYVLDTAANQKQVRKLRRKDNLMSDIIAAQGKKIANSDGLLKRLRSELAAYESGEKQAVFRDRRNRHRAACLKMKTRLVTGYTIDSKQMATLVRTSDNTVEWLESAAKKGEKILRLASLCRKFETRREKVMPYGSEPPHSPTQAKINLRPQKSDDSLVANAVTTTCGLTRLWQRISKAELTKRALLREKSLLEQENTCIMRKIEAYREKNGGPDVLKYTVSTEKKMFSPPVAVDGVTEIKKYKKNI